MFRPEHFAELWVTPDEPARVGAHVSHTLVEIEREGVVYARVYDIRGQGVTNLDAKPTP